MSAVRQVLEKAKLALKDIDLFELNEAFAAQMLACGKELGIDESRSTSTAGRSRWATRSGRAGRGC